MLSACSWDDGDHQCWREEEKQFVGSNDAITRRKLD